MIYARAAAAGGAKCNPFTLGERLREIHACDLALLRARLGGRLIQLEGEK